MSQSDPGARCIPQGEMLGELRQSESWLTRRTGIDCGLQELISHLASILGGQTESTQKRLVGARGFEPPTPWSRIRWPKEA